MEKPDIIYPCDWSYRIIATDEQQICDTVASLLNGKVYTLDHSKTSGKGNYISFKLTTEVESEADRVTLYESIKGLEFVKMVL